ncbi:Protein dom-3 [Aphelenchoides avenae]|nr:Protein dom-3 [Aphelenchus avenae]
MYKSTIGKNGAQFRLLYGAEMDCINSAGDFLEIKTQYHSVGYGRYFDLKSMKWWLQSFLVGIKKIVVGIRDDKGVVERVQYLPIEELPRKAEKWQAATCFSFLHAYLAKVKEILGEEQEGVVLLTERLPKKSAVTLKVLRNPPPEYRFLPDHFKNHFSQPQSL